MNIKRIRDWIIRVGLFLAVFISLFTSRNITSGDSAWSIYTAMSIIKEGNADLDEYREIIARSPDTAHGVEEVNGHWYTVYPLGASLIAVPFVFALDKLAPGLAEAIKHTHPDAVELFVASFSLALTAVLVYGIGRLFLNRRWSLALVFVFVFCTSVWSSVSRSLDQHVPSMLMITLALYLILTARERPQLIQFAGLPLAFSYVARPINSVSIVLLTIFVFVQYRRYFLRYLLWALVIAVPFVTFNLSVYHSLLSGYYQSYRGFALSGTFFEALVGHLISPSRGLLIFSPVLLLSPAGLYLKIRQRQFDRLDAFLVGIVALHWIVISIWPIWWAGWSYGPRMFADVLPYLAYWMIPALIALSRSVGRSRTAMVGGGLALAAWSFFVQYRGANVAEVQFAWNQQPANVDIYPARVWDWRDIQFLRGIKWGMPTDLSVSGISPESMGPDVYIQMGTNAARKREFDVTRALIAPLDRSWLAISADQAIAPELVSLFDGVAPLITAQTMEDRRPFRLYFFDAGARILKAADESERSAFWSPTVYPDLNETQPLTLPVKFGETTELLGYKLTKSSKPSKGQTLITYWRAGDHVVTPLQMFVHAIGPGGTIAAQSDRLDASAYDWRSGDLIAQVHHLTLPAQTAQVWLEVGLYNPDTGERLPVSASERAVGDRLLLQRLQP